MSVKFLESSKELDWNCFHTESVDKCMPRIHNQQNIHIVFHKKKLGDLVE